MKRFRGIRVSTGVKGLRVGTGPRGTYVAGGRKDSTSGNPLVAQRAALLTLAARKSRMEKKIGAYGQTSLLKEDADEFITYASVYSVKTGVPI